MNDRDRTGTARYLAGAADRAGAVNVVPAPEGWFTCGRAQGVRVDAASKTVWLDRGDSFIEGLRLADGWKVAVAVDGAGGPALSLSREEAEALLAASYATRIYDSAQWGHYAAARDKLGAFLAEGKGDD